MRVLVDADFLVYSCGFASQRTIYEGAALLPSGETVERVFNSSDEYAAWEASEWPAGTQVIQGRLVEAEPLAHAVYLANRTLLSIEQAVETEAGVREFDKLELYLTGKGNYRDTLATIRGYKANRIGIEKPAHYKALRRHLVQRWGAQVIEGREADDQVTIEAGRVGFDPERVVIVSVDKDLMTVPGAHYNFKKKRRIFLTEPEARANFYRQCIVGDVTDNVVGCYKSGPKKAEQIVDPAASEEAQYEAVLAEFKESVQRKGCPYAHMTPEAALLETARLLWMQRRENQVWMPPADRLTNWDVELCNAVKGAA